LCRGYFLPLTLCSISISTCHRDICNAEVVAAWANEDCTWTEALEISGLPPGDLARTLARALDALRQLGNLPYTPVRKGDIFLDGSSTKSVSPGIDPESRRLWREAARSINRYPVKDPLAFESADDIEEEDDEDIDDEPELSEVAEDM